MISELDQKEPEAPRPVNEYFTGDFRSSLEGLPADLLHRPENELEKIVKPEPKDWAMRHRFWEVIREARQAGHVSIQNYKLWQGIYSERHFYMGWMTNQPKLAWTLCEIDNYKQLCTETFYSALLRLRQYVLTEPLTSDTVGKILTVAKYFGDRGIGPVIQKVDARHLHGMVPPQVALPGNSEDAQKRLDELKQRVLETSAQVVTSVDQAE